MQNNIALHRNAELHVSWASCNSVPGEQSSCGTSLFSCCNGNNGPLSSIILGQWLPNQRLAVFPS